MNIMCLLEMGNGVIIQPIVNDVTLAFNIPQSLYEVYEPELNLNAGEPTVTFTSSY